MIGANARVRLAAKARLRRDRLTGKQFLLYPERGLELSDSAARIVQLCVGERAVAAIVDDSPDNDLGAMTMPEAAYTSPRRRSVPIDAVANAPVRAPIPAAVIMNDRSRASRRRRTPRVT